MASGIGETMVGVNTDSAKGIMDRLRSMPMAPAAVVMGRNMADMVNSFVGLAVMVGCGLVVGWTARRGLGSFLAALGLLLLLRFSFLWMGIYIGLLVKSPEMANNLWGLLFPLTMLTNAFVSPELMPDWLGAIAAWNPLSSTVSATRELFGNPGGATAQTWLTENAVTMALAWPLLSPRPFCPWRSGSGDASVASCQWCQDLLHLVVTQGVDVAGSVLPAPSQRSQMVIGVCQVGIGAMRQQTANAVGSTVSGGGAKRMTTKIGSVASTRVPAAISSSITSRR